MHTRVPILQRGHADVTLQPPVSSDVAEEKVYKAILDQPLNRTHFRMKLLKIHPIERVSILNDAVGKQGGRPPHLYRFSNQKLETVDRDFL